jgi:hypothetical protein
VQYKHTPDITLKETASQEVILSPNALPCFSWKTTTYFKQLLDIDKDVVMDINIQVDEFI